MEHEHTVEAIGERLAAGPRHNYLRDWIYGGIDGSVTTFAVVTGVVGAQLSPVVIVIMGFANLVGDGFSMAASNFLGTKSEHDDMLRLAAIEHRHIEVAPEGEREVLITKDQEFADKVAALVGEAVAKHAASAATKPQA